MVRLLVCLAVALLALAANGSATTFAEGPRVTQATLTNGLRIVVIENHALPLARVAMWYRTGSADDPAGRGGVAHALEHMMFRGTRALPGSGLDALEARIGADSNAETDYEYTHYYQTVPVDVLEVALHIEADRMRGLLLRPADWTLERRAVLAELAGYASSDTAQLEDAVRAGAYGDSPFGGDQGGTKREVERITANDLRRAYDAGYTPDNAAVVVTGDVRPATVIGLIRTLFGGIRGRATVVPHRREPIVRRGFVVRRQALNEHLVDVALESGGLRGADGGAEQIASELIRPTHPALHDLLVRDGPCSSYDVDDDIQMAGGLHHVVCHLDDLLGKEVAPEVAARAIRQALARLAARVPPGAIAAARRADRAATAFASDALSDEADLFGECIAMEGTDPRQFDRNAARVPDAAVVAVLRRWASPVGVGIVAGPLPEGSVETEPARKSRVEHVTIAARGVASVSPAWARRATPPLRLPEAASVDAFSLPNGLRLFVARRSGNGTAYVRGDFARFALVDRPRAIVRRAANLEERYAMKIDLGMPANLQGNARDLGTMIDVLAQFWRAPQRLRGDARARARRSAVLPRPDSAWIAVTGDVDPAAVFARVSRAFSSWRDSGPAGIAPSPAPSRSPAATVTPPPVVKVGPSAPRSTAYFMQSVPRRGDADFPAMALLNTILGDNTDFDTRLVHELRTRRGLAYGTGSYYDPDLGRLVLWFETASSDFTAAHAAFRGILEAVRSGRIEPDELLRARRKLLAKALRAQASPAGVLDMLGSAADAGRVPDDIESLALLYGSVTAEDVERVAREVLNPDRMIELDSGRPRTR